MAIGGGQINKNSAGSDQAHQSRDRWAGQYEGVVGPPSYETATSGSSQGRRRSLVGRWLEKRREKKEERVPGYMP